MKIALLHYSAPPVVGGVETVLARQARQLAQAGHQVCILAGRGETWDARIPVQTIPHLDSRHPQILKMKAGLDAGQVPEAFADLVDEIESELRLALSTTDVVIAHNVASLHKNLALTAALYHLSGTPQSPRMILWHHDLAWTAPRYLDELHPGYPWDLLRMAWPGVRQVTISEARRLELAELMGLDLDEVTVVPAGLDLADFLGIQPRTWSMLSRINLMNFSPILLTPVRVTRRKNLELALKVLAELRERMPQAALVITGPPGAHNPTNQEYLDSLYRLRADLGLEGAAFLLAEYHPQGLPESGVAELYRIADAVLLPSREEGFGIPILEAGLARLPVFCSDLQALRALAGEWAVYFSPDDSPRSVAKKIAKYLKADPRYQLQTRVRQEYTWEAVYQRQIAPLLEAP